MANGSRRYLDRLLGAPGPEYERRRRADSEAGPDILDLLLGQRGRWRAERQRYGGRRALRRLNVRLNDSERRLRRYHPYFVSGGRRLLNKDRRPFPNEIRRVEPHFRRNWLQNYYQDNPAAWRLAAGNQTGMNQYLRRHLTNVRPMFNWLNNHIHTVRPGETLSGISRQHNFPLSRVKAQNRWLLNRPGGRVRTGFDFIRPGDKIILPPRWNVPRGRRDPYPREITHLPRMQRQPWLRAYYQTNPLAAKLARQDARRIINFANRHLR